jgi:hypothetical protein
VRRELFALIALLLALAGAVASEWPAAQPCTTDTECGCTLDCLEEERPLWL